MAYYTVFVEYINKKGAWTPLCTGTSRKEALELAESFRKTSHKFKILSIKKFTYQELKEDEEILKKYRY